MNGVVKFYNDRKRFGFITGENDKDIFVHESGLEKQGFKRSIIKEGDNVEYKTKESQRGPIAINVRKIEAEPVETQETEKPIDEQESEKQVEDQESEQVKDEEAVTTA